MSEIEDRVQDNAGADDSDEDEHFSSPVPPKAEVDHSTEAKPHAPPPQQQQQPQAAAASRKHLDTDDLEKELEDDLGDLKLDDVDTSNIDLDDEGLLED